MTAIPLCIPNNCSWDEASRVLQRDYSQYRTGLKVVNEAWRKLRSIQGPVCVVSIAGPSRSGKSHILSKAFDQSQVFPLGYSLHPETAGIWMWVIPEKFKDNHGREFTVVLLDEEGAGAISAFDVNGDVIFSLTILLSSVLIYNSSGVPTRVDLEWLDPVIKNFQRIISLDDETCRKGFPSFVWLLRDVLSLPKDVENCKDFFLEKFFKTTTFPTEKPQKDVHGILKIFPDFDAFKLSPPSFDSEVVLEDLNKPWAQGRIYQSFREGTEEFKQMLRSKLNPKQSFVGQGFLTGGALAALVEGYVRSTNSPGVVPFAVTGAFDVPFTKKKCTQALNDAKAVYEGGMRKFRGKVRLPCDDKEIHSCHENHLQEALTFFESATKDTTEMARLVYIVELVSYTEKVEIALLMENKKLTEEQYDSIPTYIRARGKEALATYFRALETGSAYDKRTKILLIGQDSVGKTSLGKFLRGEPFDKNESSTDGVEMIPPVKNAGTGPWRNPVSLESTSALDHKCADVVTKELLSSFTEQSDTAVQDERTREEATRDEPTSEVPATAETSRDVLTHEASRQDVCKPKPTIQLDATTQQGMQRSATHDDRKEQKPEQIPPKVASLIERGLVTKNASNNDGIWPIVWDFAGQAVYRAIHPIFLSQEAIYVLVSDLTNEYVSDPANCRVKRPPNQDELEVASPYREDTSLDHIMRWLDLVHSLQTPQIPNKATHTGEGLPSDQPLESLPPVILVGTHADEIMKLGGDPCKQMESVKETICKMAPLVSIQHISKESFFIDNTKTDREEDPQIVSLRVKILDVAQRMPHTSKEIPLQWLRVEEKIDEMVKNGVRHVRRQSFQKDIAERICQFNDKNDVEELLHFLQARGTVIYHDLPENPNGLVVLDPQWLISELNKIITVNPPWKNEPGIHKHCQFLQNKGFLSNELLNRAFKNLDLESIKESLLYIMQKFDLICDAKGCRGKDYPYLVPCMLTLPKKETRGQAMHNGPLPVFLSFNTNYVPTGLFCRLVVLFWEWASGLCDSSWIVPALFANTARFNVSTEYHLTLQSYQTVIRLAIWTQRNRDIKEEQRLCEKLLSQLEYCRSKLCNTCYWLRSVSWDLLIQCTLCKPCPDKCRKETDICIWHKQKDCFHSDCGHYIPLRRFGISCEHNVSAAPSFCQEKLEPWTKALQSIEFKEGSGASAKHMHHSSRKRKVPSDDGLERLSQKIGEGWKPLGRRLKIDEAKLIAFHKENEPYSEKAYQMLLHWKEREGSAATYKVLDCALCDPLVNRKDLAEEFCSHRHKRRRLSVSI